MELIRIEMDNIRSQLSRMRQKFLIDVKQEFEQKFYYEVQKFTSEKLNLKVELKHYK